MPCALQNLLLLLRYHVCSHYLDRQNNLQLLNKAVIAGQISLIAYFVDVQSYYQSLQNYLQLQNEYQKALAKLYQYKR